MPKKLQLGVNIDHVATVRQARGTSYPDPVAAARLVADAGAHNLTMHLREDRRHIQDADVTTLRRLDLLPINLEMANHPDLVRFARRLVPGEVCLVPERRQELTTEGGLDAAGLRTELAPTIATLGRAGVRVSIFLDPDRRQLEAAAALGAPCVELHTGAFCDARPSRRERELARLLTAAEVAHALGLQVNAGHGINLENLSDILRIPFLHTLNIGHSIVARAIMVGMKAAVRDMLRGLAAYCGPFA